MPSRSLCGKHTAWLHGLVRLRLFFLMQKLIWMPEGEDRGAFAKTCEIPYTGPRPDRVWMLIGETREDAPPLLPITPRHHGNAFLEDYIHDWNISQKKFRYFSRVCKGGVWLLFEYANEQTTGKTT